MLDSQTLTTKMDANSISLDSWTQFQSVMLSGTVGIAQTTQALQKSRLHENIEAFKALMSCQHPAELAGLHSAYLETLSAHYRAYIQDMSERVGQCVNDMAINRSDGAEL